MTPVTALKTPNWQPRLGQPGEVVTEFEDIAQAIRIIVTTPLGSDPLRPTFGVDALQYLDIPSNAAAPLIAAVALAILTWEPRIALVGVVPAFDPARPGQVTLDIRWVFRGFDRETITRVELRA